MKTDFSISVQVNIGVTPEVVQLITAILQRTPPTVAITALAASEQPTPETIHASGEKKAESPTSDAATEKQGENTESPKSEEAVKTESTQEPAKELTEQDIREAMHRTRQRIEGEDYKNNTDSEGYKKYHKQLSANFKNIAALLGSDKPSTLPADKRASFIQQCDELVVKDGEITTNCPY